MSKIRSLSRSGRAGSTIAARCTRKSRRSGSLTTSLSLMDVMISDMKTVLALLALFAASICSAQAPYPSRTVTIVVPFTPATGADLIARMLQPRLAERLGQPVVVENRVGASGAIGTEMVARSPPDGYTLLFTATSHGTLPAMKRSLPYDAVKSFTPVALAATSALSFVGGPQAPAANMAQFIALAKKSPGTLYYSSPGAGSIQHLTMELVKLETGIDLVHVPYKGSSGAATDLV